MNLLLMEDILDELFKKFSIEDLKNCRSVCRLWDWRASARLKKVWKEMKIVNLSTEYEKQCFARAMFNSKDKAVFSSFRASVNTISKLGSKFISEHQPKQLDISISLNRETKLEDFLNVLKLCSKYLVQIIIDDSINFRRIVGLTKNDGDKNWLDFIFPNLKTIRYNIVLSSFNAHICQQVIQIFKEIIEHSPKLESIENPGTSVSIYSSKIISSEMLQKLTRLTMSFRQNNNLHYHNENYPDCQDLIKMQNMGLKLKYLDIGYSVNEEIEVIEKREILNDLRAIEKFLEGQSGSLEILKIRVKYDYQIKMPAVFSKLNKLVMEIYHSSFKTQLNLSSQFPQLEVIFLNLNCKKIVKWNKLFCESGLKVHTIELFNDRSKSDGEFRELEVLFPHVRNLQIGHPGKNSLKFEGFGEFWSKSVKSVSIMTYQNPFIGFDLKFFKIFKGLQKIEFLNRSNVVVSTSKYWKADFEFLKCFENLKFIKLDRLLVDQSDLTELRKIYIVDYMPGKLFDYSYLMHTFSE